MNINTVNRCLAAGTYTNVLIAVTHNGKKTYFNYKYNLHIVKP